MYEVGADGINMDTVGAAGDLVARMQMTRGMKIDEAKQYVADRINVSVKDLTDPVIMAEVRQNLQIGVVHPLPGDAKGIDAKFRIAEILGIEINCVRCFKDKTSV